METLASPSSGTPSAFAPDRATRHSLAVQRSRGLVFTLAISLGVGLRLLGLIEGNLLHLLGLGLVADLSAFVLYRLYRRGAHARLPFRLEPLWLGLDLVLIALVVVETGGAESPWWPWFLANISAAAFVLGSGAAAVVALGDTVAYVAALVWVGDVALFDQTLHVPITRMACLYGAAWFFLRGVSSLQQKHEEIFQLEEEEGRKLTELKRVTGALEQRTLEMNEARLQVAEADRLKTQFLANMSHELRTPLNSIIGFSEILQSRLSGELSERHARFLDHIHTSGQNLLEIINDILDLSKIEAGRLELSPERFPVQTIVDGVCTVIRGMAKKRGVRIETAVAADVPSVEADPVRLKQILYNLVSNAVKFSYEDSVVQIGARRLAAEASPLGVESIELAVRDEGIGIAPEDREVIFEEFRQADGTTSREFQGTGLGLTLVRRFAELHQGLVEVESTVGTGSTFRVVLPRVFAGPRGGGDGAVPSLPPLGNGRSVLVVEDDPTAYATISRHLAEGSFRPVRARSGEEAIRIASRLRPLAITLDIVLPGVDGWEVLRQLKANAQTRGIPVIIVSMLDNRELGLTLGADDYLVKPIDRELLLERLRALLPTINGATVRLLLIDDEPKLHDLVDAALAPLGFELEHAYSGREGLEAARRTEPDLIVLDLMMDEMDGFDVAAALKNDGSTARVPIVVLTAKEMTSEDRRRLHGKIEALLDKGENTGDRLASVIRDLVTRKSSGGGR